ncbi:MAG TPA: TonB-dependent receptor [Gemmatimonadaceae bacterium]|nr:TonB-dependent receptor [Gemmatimonadaceae bacterium]
MVHGLSRSHCRDRSYNRLLFAFFICILFTHVLDAATLRGRVIDSTGAPLPGVTVEARNPARSVALTTTGNDGRWILNVADSVYDVSFSLINFATTVKRAVRAGEAETASIDQTLYLSATADIVVTAKQTFRNLADLNEPVNDLIGFAVAGTVGVVTAAQIERQPARRPGDLLEAIPGVIISQHSGEGKANQYYLRGFNLDHGTDVAITVAGAPVNLPTHGHGQGWADVNFLIPELVSGIQYKKGTYFADEGDFATAGAINVNYANILDKQVITLSGGEYGWARALVAGSPRVGPGFLLYGIEAAHNDGPWDRGDDYKKLNGVLRYSQGGQRGGYSISAMGYKADWSSTDQIPRRAVESGQISRFGLIDASDGAESHRYSLTGEWQRTGTDWLAQGGLFYIDSYLDIFSNFTYFLDDPENGDQFEQLDQRKVTGGQASFRRILRWGSLNVENVVGLQLRNDDIGAVGLYKTRARIRFSTVRTDQVDERSSGLFAQSSIQWSDKFRTVLGVRGDRFSFRVASDNPQNSGEQDASIISPKLSVIAGPFRNTELYANFGTGFHSNDGRGTTQTVDPVTGEALDAVDPLVSTKGAEIGLRSKPTSRFLITGGLWGLDIDSELLFIGDAGTTEASRPSRRTGFELESYYNFTSWLVADADLAYSRARFRDQDPAGDRIPGAVEGVASVGLSVVDLSRFSGSLRYRYFGPRPLIEDDSVRSKSASLVNSRLGYSFTDNIRVNVDIHNLLDSKDSDIDYFYASRLPGEPAEGVEDFHTHPVEPRSFRVTISRSF